MPLSAEFDNAAVCHECGAVVAQIEELQDALLRSQRQLTQARAELAAARRDDAVRDPRVEAEALEVAQYWKQLLAPRTRELKGPRVEKTYARLRGDGTDPAGGYTVEELKQAVYGYYCRQYVVDGKRRYKGKPSDRHVDLELIMRDPKHVDAGLAFAREDAKYDVEMIHRGASYSQSLICDCGHPGADHLRPDLAFELGLIDAQASAPIPREPCAHKDCDCYTFDTIHRQADEWLEERMHTPPPPEPPAQLRLIEAA